MAFLVSRLEEIPFASYGAATLDLVKELAKSTFKHGTAFDLRFLDLLWTLMQDDSGAVASVRATARSKFGDMFHNFTFRPHRVAFLDKCVANVAAHRSVCQSLLAMQAIFDTYERQKNTLVVRVLL
jgi:hypothetical protein